MIVVGFCKMAARILDGFQNSRWQPVSKIAPGSKMTAGSKMAAGIEYGCQNPRWLPESKMVAIIQDGC